MKPGWLSDEGWQKALRDAVRSGEVILHERRLITRPDGSTYYEVDLSYGADATSPDDYSRSAAAETVVDGPPSRKDS